MRWRRLKLGLVARRRYAILCAAKTLGMGRRSMVASTVDIAHARTHKNRFYVWMAGVFVLIAFGGFIPTYWSRLATGSFSGAPVHHVHATLFFTWTLFFFVQTVWVAAGRIADHRAWGLAGISLATAM